MIYISNKCIISIKLGININYKYINNCKYEAFNTNCSLGKIGTLLCGRGLCLFTVGFPLELVEIPNFSDIFSPNSYTFNFLITFYPNYFKSINSKVHHAKNKKSSTHSLSRKPEVQSAIKS